MHLSARPLVDLHSCNARFDLLLREWEASKQARDPRRRATICLQIALTHLAEANVTGARQFQQLAVSAVTELPTEESGTLFAAILRVAHTIDCYTADSPLLASERMIQARNWPAAIVELEAVIESMTPDGAQCSRLALAHEALGYAWFQIGDQTRARQSFETAEQIAMVHGIEHFKPGNARVYREALVRLRTVAEAN